MREAHQFKASKPTLPQALADDGLNLILFGLGHGDIRSLKPWQSQGKASRARDLQESVDKSAPKLLLQWRQRVARAAEVTLAQNQWEAGPALKTNFNPPYSPFKECASIMNVGAAVWRRTVVFLTCNTKSSLSFFFFEMLNNPL